MWFDRAMIPGQGRQSLGFRTRCSRRALRVPPPGGGRSYLALSNIESAIRLINLIRRGLKAGVLVDGTVHPSDDPAPLTLYKLSLIEQSIGPAREAVRCRGLPGRWNAKCDGGSIMFCCTKDDNLRLRKTVFVNEVEKLRGITGG
jgi:hypothetical protein